MKAPAAAPIPKREPEPVQANLLGVAPVVIDGHELPDLVAEVIAVCTRMEAAAIADAIKAARKRGLSWDAIEQGFRSAVAAAVDEDAKGNPKPSKLVRKITAFLPHTRELPREVRDHNQTLRDLDRMECPPPLTQHDCQWLDP